jgi:hypothetical protein
LGTNTTGCGICHYTLLMLLTNTVWVNEAGICIINMHTKQLKSDIDYIDVISQTQYRTEA